MVRYRIWNQKQKDPNSAVKSTHFDRVHTLSLILKVLGYAIWPAVGLGIVLYFRHPIKQAIDVLMHLTELKSS